MLTFKKWSGPEGMAQHIINETGCKPFSGAGINPRPGKYTTILRSVDDTYYYDDNLDDITHVKYTLFGHNGDQDVNEPKFNEPLLNDKKTDHIYLYRFNKKEYIWYGKYKIFGRTTKRHIGKDGNMRNIIILTLVKCNR
jgi:hypothetical protein